MRTIDPRRTADHAIEAARRRAGQSPEARLACPVCATSLKGTNLARHLGEKHPILDTEVQHATADHEVLVVGIDRRIRRTYALLVAVGFAIMVAVVVANPDPVASDPDATLAEIARDPIVIALALVLLTALCIAGLDIAKVFRAQVTVNGREVRLRHRLGTGRRRVPLPATVETGTLFTRRSRSYEQGSGSNLSVDERSGAYLRIAHGRRSITIGCPHATGLRKHWTGWTAGRRRKWWDVNLSAPAFVELQYALADAGVLTTPG